MSLTAARLAEGLRARGHRIQLIRPRQADESWSDGADETLLTVPGIRLPMYPQLQLGLPARRRILALWQRQRPDLVHIVTEGPLGRSALNLAQRLNLPVVAGFHTNFHRYSDHYGLGFLRGPVLGYLRRFHNRCALNLVPTAELAEELARLGMRHLRVLARGVNTERFHPRHRCRELRHEWGAGESDPVALYVGRLAPEKNLVLLERAFVAMRAANPRLRLVLVGDGPAAEGLRRRHPDALFRGMRTGADLARHYASADLFPFPSLTETFGNVVLEAMASGLAVVAFDRAAARQHIAHGESGLLATDDAGFITQAVALADDRTRSEALGRQARAAVEPYAWDRIHDCLVALYQEALAGRNAA